MNNYDEINGLFKEIVEALNEEDHSSVSELLKEIIDHEDLPYSAFVSTT